jgi:hypothetical protein
MLAAAPSPDGVLWIEAMECVLRGADGGRAEIETRAHRKVALTKPE